LDPKIGKPYIYSTTKNHWEYQLAFTLENSWLPTAMINWDYKSVSIDILPSIVLAINTWNNVDISTSQNANAFVLNGQTKNLPYTFKDSYSPQVSIASFGDLKNLITDLKSENLYWQNSDYRNCDEIKQAGKNLSWVTEYQTLNNSWVLVDVTCSF
jgi:hypothetical protein